MKTAIIMIDEKRSENVAVKQYGDSTALYIDAPSAQDGARLLIENKDRPADPVEDTPVTPPTEPEQKDQRYKVFDMEAVNYEVENFEQSEAGQAFSERVLAANNDIFTEMGLSISEVIYLKNLVLQGRSLKAFRIAYLLGKYDKQ